MKISWYRFLRRLATGLLVMGTSAWSAAMSYAQVIASDNASDPVYADEWTAEDNGGTGFTAWNFDGSYPGIHLIDSASSFNQIGTAWSLGNELSNDVARAGRGFSPLQVGQTLSMLIDNPPEVGFYRGFIIRLNSSSNPNAGNICPGSQGPRACTPDTTSVERFGLFTFDNMPPSSEDPVRWRVSDSAGSQFTDLNTPDTDAGVRIDFKLTGTNTYDLTMTPLDDPLLAYERSGSLTGAGNINWLEFVQFGLQSDDTEATDLYIREIKVLGAAPAFRCDLNGDNAVDAADAGTLFANWGTNNALADINDDGVVDAADAGICFGEWTGDPGPASPGTAKGEYNVQTGELTVSVQEVVNWYVQSASNGLTGSPLRTDELGGGLKTDNSSRVGETALGQFSYTDAHLGAVAAPGLAAGDLTIYWNARLGGQLLSAPVAYVPEPGSWVLVVASLSLLLGRNRFADHP